MSTAVSPQQPLRPAVAWIAASCALSSGVALVISILTDRPLWLTSTFVFLPGFVGLVALTVMARRDEQDLFLTRLWIGVVAGVLATLAYDVVRWAIEAADLTSTHSFLAIRAFGAGLTDTAASTWQSGVAGWAFHAANGIGFAVAYVMVAAGRRWWWAVLYALVLEAFMISLYPGWLGLTLSGEFFSVSITGHVAYGVVLGVIAQRCA